MDEKQERMMRADNGRRGEQLARMARNVRSDRGLANESEDNKVAIRRDQRAKAALRMERNGRKQETKIGKRLEHVYSLDGKRMEKQKYDKNRHDFVRYWNPRVRHDTYNRKYDFTNSGKRHHTGQRRFDDRIKRINQKHRSKEQRHH